MKKIGSMPDRYKVGNEEAAVAGFMKALEALRGRTYVPCGRPDKENRGARAADYLFEEQETGRSVAVEHTQLVSEAEQEVAQLLSKGKTPRTPSKERLAREGIDSMRVNPSSPAPMVHSRTLDAAQWQVVKDMLLTKIRKGQLQATHADERLLLVEDANVSLPDSVIATTDIEFTDEERDGVDGCYVVLDQESIRMVWGPD